MTPAENILTAQQMRDAELAAANSGVSLATMMDRAGAALAELARRVAAGRAVQLLVGTGNNGGDGYVAAALLRQSGVDVEVLALAPPRTALAIAAAQRWDGPIGRLIDPPQPGKIMVDCLFGTGLNRPLAADGAELLRGHAAVAARRIAADLPSGIATDSGAMLGCPYSADVTLAFGAFKPAHLLFPAAANCGAVRVADIGIVPQSEVFRATMPPLAAPDQLSHKYRRGLVAVIAGRMGGAAELAARGAVRGGAGYVRLVGGRLPPQPPYAIVRASWPDGAQLEDSRLGAVVIGCGLGSDAAAVEKMAAVRAVDVPVVIDADGLNLLGATPMVQPAVLTPHAGEFDRLWPEPGSKIDRTRRAAAHWQAVIVHKGADTVIAAPDGRVAIHSPGDAWLSTAGTGDVLAGLCGAMLARGLAPFDAAQAAVILHQRAARRAGPGLCADDLLSGALWP